MPGEDALRSERDAAWARLAELEQAQQAFLHSVTHDLRAPLRHVTSYAGLLREVLQELPDPPEQVREALEFAATMERSSRRMAAMLDGLLALSRAARVPLQCQAVDLSAALHSVRATLPGAETLRWEVTEPLPVIHADPALLAQLLTELLGNTIKFTAHQSPPCITVQGETLGDGRVCITLRDNGVGFDGAHAQGLFGVFQRLHREGEFDGVGTGLALCKTIAERHGATIAITAAPGEGCCVALHWPLN